MDDVISPGFISLNGCSMVGIHPIVVGQRSQGKLFVVGLGDVGRRNFIYLRVVLGGLLAVQFRWLIYSLTRSTASSLDCS